MNTPPQIDRKKFEKVAKQLSASISRPWTVMELCNGQTRTFLESWMREFLPEKLTVVHGPGCAICAAPTSFIDTAIEIAQEDNVILCASGDLLRLRGTRCDLLEIKAQGKDIRVVHSALDSLAIARDQPDKKVVFFAIGFEMVAQSNALSIWQAKRLGLKNYFLLSFQGYVPAVVKRILKEPDSRVQGMIGLAEVATICGYNDFDALSKRFNVPIVVTGFEPNDLLEGLKISVDLMEKGNATVENQYRSGVSRDGNREAKSLIKEVFELVDQEWRGIGDVERGGYRLKPDFLVHDAIKEFQVKVEAKDDSPVCISREILLGFKKPTDCPIFAKSCRPGTPLGATMVSSEGTCATYFNFYHEHHL